MKNGLGGWRSRRNLTVKRWRGIDRRDVIDNLWRQVDIRKKVAGIAKSVSQRVCERWRLSGDGRASNIGLQCGSEVVKSSVNEIMGAGTRHTNDRGEPGQSIGHTNALC